MYKDNGKVKLELSCVWVLPMIIDYEHFKIVDEAMMVMSMQ